MTFVKTNKQKSIYLKGRKAERKRDRGKVRATGLGQAKARNEEPKLGLPHE